MLRYILPVGVLVLLLAVFTAALRRDPNELTALPSPFLGKQAPGFELPSIEDPKQTVSSTEYAGKTVLVNVWATWCVGCRQEHGFLLQLSKSGAIPIYGINWRDSRPDALNWLEQLGDPYVASGDDSDGTVGINWGVYGAPETFLIAADGTVLYKHLGPLSRPVWEQDFVPRLQSAESPQ